MLKYHDYKYLKKITASPIRIIASETGVYGYTMNASGAFQAYKKAQVQTADQGTLLIMCYDRAINFLKQAREAIVSQDTGKQNEMLTKAQNILWELASCLNFEAGEIAYNLDSLYNYMIRRLVDAQYRSSVAMVDEVLGHLQEMKKSWQTIIHKKAL